MIEFKDYRHFFDVVKFAASVGAANKLIERLDYLAEYHNGENTVEIYKDWAPHSFTFVMKKPDGAFWFNGGLIYSGPDQPLDGSAPALTVGIGIDSSVHGWSIHT